MVPRSLLAAAAIAFLTIAAAPAQTTGEIPLSTPIYGVAPSDQEFPKVATNGSEFLAVWLDVRGAGPLYATRIGSDGTILDPTGIRIPGATGPVLGLFRMDGAYTLVGNDVIRIGDDGRIIEPPHPTISRMLPRVAASNGSRILLAGDDQIAILDEHGTVLSQSYLPNRGNYGYAAASNGSTFLLVTFSSFNQQNNVTQYAIDANGNVTGSSTVGASGTGEGPLIGSDGTDYVVVYSDARTGSTVTQRIASNAVPLTTNALPVNSFQLQTGTLTWTGSNYLLTTLTADQQQPAVTLVDRNGVFLGPLKLIGGTGTPGTINAPSVAWNGSRALFAWTSGTQLDLNALDVDFALLNADGSVAVPPAPMAISANAQSGTVIAGGGVNDLAVWYESTGIYATRLTPSGKALDGRGILVDALQSESRLLVSGDTNPLRVVFDGETYLVAWQTGNSVIGQRIDPATGALVGAHITLASCAKSFDLGVDEAGVLLASADCSSRIFAQRIGATGAAGLAVTISPTDVPAGAPRMAWNGQEWLIVWQRLIELPILVFPPAYRGNVYAQRLTSTLVVRDTAPIEIAVSDQDEESPLVASDGRDFLVTWTHRWDTNVVDARHVAADGTLSDTVTLAPAYLGESLVWDGTRYAIAYRTAYTLGDVLLTHATRDGAAIGDSVVISATDFEERNASLLARGGGVLRVAYVRVAPEPVYGGVPRAFAKDVVTILRRRVAR